MWQPDGEGTSVVGRGVLRHGRRLVEEGMQGGMCRGAFNSHKKCSGVITRDNTTGSVVVHRKGAAEVVLANCSMYVGIDGATSELVFEQRKQLEKVINDMAVGGLRCLAFAYKEDAGDLSMVDDDEGLLTLLGLVGLKDSCRPDVSATIEAVRKAGVAVKMVTGDNILTARAIARECGIISSNDDPDEGVVIEGHEFRSTSIVRQLEIADKILVMGRAQPLDKLLLVQRLKQTGHVVAVTGDGPNDGPALKEADIGLSMGIQGTDVTKDLIILNDRFGTVVTATGWGRSVYFNIQSQLTVNVTALCVDIVSAITMGGNTPLTTAQLMWVNMAMGAASALALAVDSPTVALMNRPPIARTAPLVSNAMWRNLAAQAAFQTAVLLALQYLGKVSDTMIFNVFVLCQVFNEFNVRDIERKNVLEGLLEKNGGRMFLVIVAMTLVLHVLAVEVLTRFAGTERLGSGQ
uniref:Uncharacterized protein n=1 Tax=Avena sativa TaxID=4498 RepID=A0ACD5TC78_AVESA